VVQLEVPDRGKRRTRKWEGRRGRKGGGIEMGRKIRIEGRHKTKRGVRVSEEEQEGEKEGSGG